MTCGCDTDGGFWLLQQQEMILSEVKFMQYNHKIRILSTQKQFQMNLKAVSASKAER